MKTRTQRLTRLADRLGANVMGNLEEWKHRTGMSIVAQVTENLACDFVMFKEADPTHQEHYLAGRNYSRHLVMYAITGDDDWLPDERCDPHITF